MFVCEIEKRIHKRDYRKSGLTFKKVLIVKGSL